jgi:hypothetical protein
MIINYNDKYLRTMDTLKNNVNLLKEHQNEIITLNNTKANVSLINEYNNDIKNTLKM